MPDSDSRPYLLFLCHPLTGHFTPTIKIATALNARGWSIGFLGSTFFRPRIEASGAEFFQLQGAADLDDAKLFDKDPNVVLGDDTLSCSARSIIDSRHQTLHTIPAAWESFKSALLELHRCNADRQVIVVCEAFFYGFMPMKYGAPLPPGVKMPRSICISILAPAIRSVDLPPFAFPGRFDPSPSGHAINAALWLEWEQQARPVTELLDRKLRDAGASRGIGEVYMSGANYTCHDAILQIGLPEFEYPRSDFPPGFKIVGIISPPRQAGQPSLDWWEDLISNSSLDSTDPRRRKVVVVAQGTVETDPTELILPTIQWLSNREDIVAIAILGSRGANLPKDIEIPRNAKIVDYLNYDTVLPYADLWIHNGGYGATTHGISHGVPMVIAGDGQDKPESAKRVAWSGVGIDLVCARPGIDRLGKAIDEVLEDRKYTNVASGMKKTAGEMGCFELIEEEILTLIEM